MISAVVLTKNEEDNIQACLETLRWCDEMVLVDDYSTDRTRDIAKKMGAKVFLRLLENDFAGQRNFGLSKASGDWILFVDADERVCDSLRLEINKQKLTDPDYSGFYLRRKDYFEKNWLKFGETASARLLRLGKRGCGKWFRPVHEVWKIEGKIRELRNPIFHYPHPTTASFLKKINFYSTLHAEVLFKEGKKTNLLLIMLKPSVKFIWNWILRFGFLDGMPGFILAGIMSFHSFLAQAKLYLRWKK